MNQNRNPRNRGFSQNGAPAGYGQQRGASPFLDQEQQPQDERGGRAPMASDQFAPAAPEQPETDFASQFGPQGPPNPDVLQQALQRNGGVAGGRSYGQPTASTGSGDFGRGARVPGGTAAGRYVPGSADPRDADPASGYGWGGVANPAYAGAQPQAPAAPTTAPQKTGLAAAVSAARANNFSDIEGAQNVQAGGFANQLEGFGNIDPGGERGSNTHKKLFGRIASRYDVTQPGAVRTMMQDPDFIAAFPDAKLVEHPNADLIDFGDGNPVDVIRGAVAGGSGGGWQWGVNAPGGGTPGAQGAPIGATVPPGANAGPSDVTQQLMAALNGQNIDPSSLEQLLAALGLGSAQQNPAAADLGGGYF